MSKVWNYSELQTMAEEFRDLVAKVNKRAQFLRGCELNIDLTINSAFDSKGLIAVEIAKRLP